MKTFVLLVAVLFVSSRSSTQSRPIPRGVRQAEQAELQGEKSIPGPKIYRYSVVSSEQLRQDAAQLAGLGQSVPTDIDQTGKGMLPKDLDQKLRRIEKLAKHLRSRISR